MRNQGLPPLWRRRSAIQKRLEGVVGGAVGIFYSLLPCRKTGRLALRPMLTLEPVHILVV